MKHLMKYYKQVDAIMMDRFYLSMLHVCIPAFEAFKVGEPADVFVDRIFKDVSFERIAIDLLPAPVSNVIEFEIEEIEIYQLPFNQAA